MIRIRWTAVLPVMLLVGCASAPVRYEPVKGQTAEVAQRDQDECTEKATPGWWHYWLLAPWPETAATLVTGRRPEQGRLNQCMADRGYNVWK